MKLDSYGRTTIRNIYFDTDTFRLIRRSLEGPVYKEKLRVRSYKPVHTTEPVSVEIKKKLEIKAAIVIGYQNCVPQFCCNFSCIHNVFHLSFCLCFVLAVCPVSDGLHIFSGKTKAFFAFF